MVIVIRWVLRMRGRVNAEAMNAEVNADPLLGQAPVLATRLLFRSAAVAAAAASPKPAALAEAQSLEQFPEILPMSQTGSNLEPQ